jgi:cell division protein FtsB
MVSLCLEILFACAGFFRQYQARSLVGGDMTSPEGPNEGQKPKILRGSHKLLAVIALALGLALVFVVFSHRGLYEIYRFRKEKLLLEQEISKLAAENERLARTIERLQHDPEMVQDLIRRELNFTKKNEIIFQLPPETGGKSPLPPASPQAEPAAAPQVKPGPSGKTGLKGDSRASLEGAAQSGGLRQHEPAVIGGTAASPKPRAASPPR